MLSYMSREFIIILKIIGIICLGALFLVTAYFGTWFLAIIIEFNSIGIGVIPFLALPLISGYFLYKLIRHDGSRTPLLSLLAILFPIFGISYIYFLIQEFEKKSENLSLLIHFPKLKYCIQQDHHSNHLHTR